MRNFITGVFDDKAKAYEALHALWQLDRASDITVHGTAVVHRDAFGRFQVDTKETQPALATAFGVGIGALLGALAGPAGIAIGVAAGATIGAATGAAVGVAADVVRSDTRQQAELEAAAVIEIGQSAVIADVTEDWTSPVNTCVQRLGGKLYRRTKSALRFDSWFDDGYLYPYEYVPTSDSLWAL
jgi:uncharacterized membrane protein